MAFVMTTPIRSRVNQRLEAAVIAGINDTTAAAVISAKRNHPGWKNRTGAAEGSIRQRPAVIVGQNRYRGGFGSFAVFYFIFLELGTRFITADHTLRRAADAEFPRIGANIARHLA